jgi:fatty-acyl-CoA synthase
MGSGTQFNLGLVQEAVASSVPEREAIVWGDLRLSHAQLAERSRRLASYLNERGLGCRTERRDLRGHESGQDHLGLYLYNGNEYLEGMLGAFKARVASFNVNYRYVRDELKYLLGDAGARGVIYHAMFAPVLAEVLADVDSVEVLIQVADESGHPLLEGAVDYEEALAGADPDGPGLEPSPDDLYILYTGGTTGMPKGVLWRQHDIFVAAMGGRALGDAEVVGSYEAIAERAKDGSVVRFLVLPPLIHGAAQWVALTALNAGGTVVLPPHTRRLEPDEAWDTVSRERVLAVSVVGDAMARPMVEALEARPRDVAPLFTLLSGGAPLNASLKERLTDLVPSLVITDAVGSSETGAQMRHVSTRGSVATGRFIPGPGPAVLDEEMKGLVHPGHEGIGWLAQEGYVPLGYLGDADKTFRTFPVVGGVRYAVPGDRARLLADGEIELLGRDSVTINSGGEKIFAEEVEAAIGSHPDVSDVVVVGRPSARWGQEVVALVQRAPGTSPSAETLNEHASAVLARYKLPKEVIFLDHIERSPSGKADYRWAAAQVSSA